MIPADEALERLKEGNHRFVSNQRDAGEFLSQARRFELAQSQEPFAIILGCSDSRGQAVRLNVSASADHLRHGSPVLEQLIKDAGLLVVGAEYSLETGRVEFFDVPVR